MYFDDDEEGPAPQTSHPRFRSVATEDFFYDVCDDFSPFGNDDGADTLAALHEWYRGGKTNMTLFVAELDAAWNLPKPVDLEGASETVLAEWVVADSMHGRHLASHANVRLAVAFGQLKITGVIEPKTAELGLRALDWKRMLNDQARLENPGWAHADEERARIESMDRALRAAIR